MKKILDWSRPRTWVLLGLLIAIIGAALGTEDEGGAGSPLIVAGVVLMLIGGAAYVVTQFRKGNAAGRD